MLVLNPSHLVADGLFQFSLVKTLKCMSCRGMVILVRQGMKSGASYADRHLQAYCDDTVFFASTCHKLLDMQLENIVSRTF